ncbi:UNVERIFIED_ORG: hypothetical protein GGR78_000582 [Xanthomonas campestris]
MDDPYLSLLEANVNTAIGFGISWTVTPPIMAAFGCSVGASEAAGIKAAARIQRDECTRQLRRARFSPKARKIEQLREQVGHLQRFTNPDAGFKSRISGLILRQKMHSPSFCFRSKRCGDRSGQGKRSLYLPAYFLNILRRLRAHSKLSRQLRRGQGSLQTRYPIAKFVWQGMQARIVRLNLRKFDSRDSCSYGFPNTLAADVIHKSSEQDCRVLKMRLSDRQFALKNNKKQVRLSLSLRDCFLRRFTAQSIRLMREIPNSDGTQKRHADARGSDDNCSPVRNVPPIHTSRTIQPMHMTPPLPNDSATTGKAASFKANKALWAHEQHADGCSLQP